MMKNTQENQNNQEGVMHLSDRYSAEFADDEFISVYDAAFLEATKKSS